MSALEGVSTEALQEALNGRKLSVRNIAEAGRGSAAMGAVGDLAGKYGTNALAMRAKGMLGEELAKLKAYASGYGYPVKGEVTPEILDNFPGTIESGPQTKVRLSDSVSTIADLILKQGKAVEAKFGFGAKLSTNQKRAAALFDPEIYWVEHYLPSDIGRAAALGAGALRPRDDERHN